MVLDGFFVLCFAERRPPCALICVTDHEEIEAAQLQGVLQFIVNGKDPQGEPFGLGQLKEYAYDLCEVSCQDFGLPLPQKCLMILLVRLDCGGPQKAKEACAIVRLLSGRLNRSTLPEFLFDARDPRLKEARTTKTQPQQGSGKRLLLKEAKALGADCASPYWQSQDGRRDPNKWFPDGSEVQKLHVNVAHAQAQKNGMHLDSLVLDVWQSVKDKDRVWRDDGLLPRCSSKSSGLHYVYSRHRTVTGREELACRGYPLDRISFKCVNDDHDLVRHAVASIPVPVVGAALYALLLVTKLGFRWIFRRLFCSMINFVQDF